MTFPEPKISGDYRSSEQIFYRNNPLGAPEKPKVPPTFMPALIFQWILSIRKASLSLCGGAATPQCK